MDKDGRATVEFLRTINSTLQSIAYALNQVIALPEIQAALIALDAATAAAQAAADNANSAATVVADQSNLANSYVDGLTLGATDAGTNATITVSAHSRVYGDGTTVAVAGGSITALAYSTLYYITYEDPTRAGGTVTYMTTTNAAVAAQTGNTHVVGSIMTPAAAAPPQVGSPVLPPGAGAINRESTL